MSTHSSSNSQHDELHDPASPPYDQELSKRLMTYAIVALTLMSIGGFLVGKVSYSYFISDLASDDPTPLPLAAANERSLPPSPRLQEFPPTTDIEAFYEWEDRRLDSYGVLSEEDETYRIPVERAMEILAERGLPVAGNIDDASREIFGTDVVEAPQEVRVPTNAQVPTDAQATDAAESGGGD